MGYEVLVRVADVLMAVDGAAALGGLCSNRSKIAEVANLANLANLANVGQFDNLTSTAATTDIVSPIHP